MSQPHEEQPSETPVDHSKTTANPNQQSTSEKKLEIARVGLDYAKAEDQNEAGLSPDKLKQIADEINSNLQDNKEPNWRVETDWDESKVNVRLD